MPLLGLTGYPLSHSFSPAYFRQKFEDEGLSDWDYRLFPLIYADMIPKLTVSEKNLIALNVTIPHKQAVLKHCQYLSDDVKAIGAANLILINRTEGKKPELQAHNTDHYGFITSLKNSMPDSDGRALILGDGGSSKAVAYALSRAGMPFDIAGRNLKLNYNNVLLQNYRLIVNCTPVGMKTEQDSDELLPLNYNIIKDSHFFYDLVYNPETTAMMKKFSEKGAIVKNGLEMLHLQADRGWEIIKAHYREIVS